MGIHIDTITIYMPWFSCIAESIEVLVNRISIVHYHYRNAVNLRAKKCLRILFGEFSMLRHANGKMIVHIYAGNFWTRYNPGIILFMLAYLKSLEH